MTTFQIGNLPPCPPGLPNRTATATQRRRSPLAVLGHGAAASSSSSSARRGASLHPFPARRGSRRLTHPVSGAARLPPSALYPARRDAASTPSPARLGGVPHPSRFITVRTFASLAAARLPLLRDRAAAASPSFSLCLCLQLLSSACSFCRVARVVCLLVVRSRGCRSCSSSSLAWAPARAPRASAASPTPNCHAAEPETGTGIAISEHHRLPRVHGTSQILLEEATRCS